MRLAGGRAAGRGGGQFFKRQRHYTTGAPGGPRRKSCQANWLARDLLLVLSGPLFFTSVRSLVGWRPGDMRSGAHLGANYFYYYHFWAPGARPKVAAAGATSASSNQEPAGQARQTPSGQLCP